MLVTGSIFLIVVFSISITEEKIIELQCSPEFWENNLELWKVVGVNYNDDFDEIFGKNYFEVDITLKQAISKKGVGVDKLAREGTAAYLNALADPNIDEEKVRETVHFGYIHQIQKYNANCEASTLVS